MIQAPSVRLYKTAAGSPQRRHKKKDWRTTQQKQEKLPTLEAKLSVLQDNSIKNSSTGLSFYSYSPNAEVYSKLNFNFTGKNWEVIIPNQKKVRAIYLNKEFFEHHVAFLELPQTEQAFARAKYWSKKKVEVIYFLADDVKKQKRVSYSEQVPYYFMTAIALPPHIMDTLHNNFNKFVQSRKQLAQQKQLTLKEDLNVQQQEQEKLPAWESELSTIQKGSIKELSPGLSFYSYSPNAEVYSKLDFGKNWEVELSDKTTVRVIYLNKEFFEHHVAFLELPQTKQVFARAKHWSKNKVEVIYFLADDATKQKHVSYSEKIPYYFMTAITLPPFIMTTLHKGFNEFVEGRKQQEQEKKLKLKAKLKAKQLKLEAKRKAKQQEQEKKLKFDARLKARQLKWEAELKAKQQEKKLKLEAELKAKQQEQETKLKLEAELKAKQQEQEKQHKLESELSTIQDNSIKDSSTGLSFYSYSPNAEVYSKLDFKFIGKNWEVELSDQTTVRAIYLNKEFFEHHVAFLELPETKQTFAGGKHWSKKKVEVIYFLADDVKKQKRVSYRETSPHYFMTAIAIPSNIMARLRQGFNKLVEGRKQLAQQKQPTLKEDLNVQQQEQEKKLKVDAMLNAKQLKLEVETLIQKHKPEQQQLLEAELKAKQQEQEKQHKLELKTLIQKHMNEQQQLLYAKKVLIKYAKEQQRLFGSKELQPEIEKKMPWMEELTARQHEQEAQHKLEVETLIQKHKQEQQQLLESWVKKLKELSIGLLFYSYSPNAEAYSKLDFNFIGKNWEVKLPDKTIVRAFYLNKEFFEHHVAFLELPETKQTFAGGKHWSKKKVEVIYFLADDVKKQKRVSYREQVPAYFMTAISIPQNIMARLRQKFGEFVEARKEHQYVQVMDELRSNLLQKYHADKPGPVYSYSPNAEAYSMLDFNFNGKNWEAIIPNQKKVRAIYLNKEFFEHHVAFLELPHTKQVFTDNKHVGDSDVQIIYFLADSVKRRVRVRYREVKTGLVFFATAVSFKSYIIDWLRLQFHEFVQFRKKQEQLKALKELKRQKPLKYLQRLVSGPRTRLPVEQVADIKYMYKIYRTIKQLTPRFLTAKKVTRQACFFVWRHAFKFSGRLWRYIRRAMNHKKRYRPVFFKYIRGRKWKIRVLKRFRFSGEERLASKYSKSRTLIRPKTKKNFTYKTACQFNQVLRGKTRNKTLTELSKIFIIKALNDKAAPEVFKSDLYFSLRQPGDNPKTFQFFSPSSNVFLTRFLFKLSSNIFLPIWRKEEISKWLFKPTTNQSNAKRFKKYKWLKRRAAVNIYKYLKLLRVSYFKYSRQKYSKWVRQHHMRQCLKAFKKTLGFFKKRRLVYKFNFLELFYLKTKTKPLKKLYRNRIGVYHLIVLLQRMFEWLYAQSNLKYTFNSTIRHYSLPFITDHSVLILRKSYKLQT